VTSLLKVIASRFLGERKPQRGLSPLGIGTAVELKVLMPEFFHLALDIRQQGIKPCPAHYNEYHGKNDQTGRLLIHFDLLQVGIHHRLR
jgi:hypothetical protein